MTDASRPYAIHSNREVERLERQARLAGLEDHLKHLDVRAGDAVVDLGCGSGSMARLIAKTHPRAHVIGIDLREEYLEGARQLGAGLDNLSFQQGDVVALPFADASIDVIWTKYLLQWLKSPEGALREAKRVLKPGGRITTADFVDFMVEHHTADPAFDAAARRLMPGFVDVGMGRKVAPILMGLGFADVSVAIETDRLFTVVGSIDPERRWNWEIQWEAARPRLVTLAQSEEAADRFIAQFFAHHDDPKSCTFVSLFITRAVKPIQ